jgi:trimethylamine--corrinoid protein Co-methyltransferase
VTLDGAIAQSSAEILAGLVVHQLEQPGAPVITASSILPMDMRSGGIAYGSPEYMMVGIGAVDFFDDLGVPTWIGAGCSDAHIVDAQAAAEAGMSFSWLPWPAPPSSTIWAFSPQARMDRWKCSYWPMSWPGA